MKKLANSDIHTLATFAGGIIGSYIGYVQGKKKNMTFLESQTWGTGGAMFGRVVALIITNSAK